MREDGVNYVVVFPGENLDNVSTKLTRKVRYDMIVSSKFVTESLRMLALKNVEDFVLYDNRQNREKEKLESQLALERLEKEEFHENLIRPKLSEMDSEATSVITKPRERKENMKKNREETDGRP